MRPWTLSGAGLVVAVLLGIAPHRALATDPPSADQASAASTSADAAAPAAKPARVPDPAQRVNRPLDLSPPPISHVMTPEQRQALTAQPDENQDADEVMVQQERYEAPVPRGQFRALAWALLHPFQAWRIFTPVTDQ